jgi:hypothetical protein
MVSLWRLVPYLRAQIMFMAVVGGCGCGEEEKTRTTFVCVVVACVVLWILNTNGIPFSDTTSLWSTVNRGL